MIAVNPYRPASVIRSPSGQQLTVECDRLRDFRACVAGEYVRLHLVDALAQATGGRPDAEWILEVASEIDHEVPTDL